MDLFGFRRREMDLLDEVEPERSALRQCFLVVGPAVTIWALALLVVYVIDVVLG